MTERPVQVASGMTVPTLGPTVYAVILKAHPGELILAVCHSEDLAERLQERMANRMRGSSALIGAVTYHVRPISLLTELP